MLRALAIILALLGTAVVATPVVFGQLALTGFNQFTTGFNEGAEGSVKLETVAYRRGYFGSHATSRLTIAALPDTSFVIEHEIRHGPFAGDGAPVFVRVHSRVWPGDASERASLESAIAELRFDYPLRAKVLRLDVAAPAYDNGRVAWQSLSGQYAMDLDSQLGQASMDAADLHVEGATHERAHFGSLHLAGHFDTPERAYVLLGLDMRTEAALFEKPGSTEGFGVLEVGFDAQPRGELLDYTGHLRMESVQVGPGELERGAFEVRLENLSPGTLDRLKALGPQGTGGAGQLYALLDSMASQAPALVVERFELVGDVPDRGRMDLRATGRIGVNAARYVAAKDTVNPLLQAIDADLDVRVNEPFVLGTFQMVGARLAGSGRTPASPRDMLERLIRQGQLTRDGDDLRLVAAMRGPHDVHVNEQPFNPGMLAAMLAPQPAVPGSVPGAAPSLPAAPAGSASPTAADKVRMRNYRPGSKDPELDEMRRQMGMH